MPATWRTIRRALGAPLSALMLLVGTAGSFLDAADLLAEPRIVSSPEAGSGARGHDHRLCLQVGANQAIASHEVLTPGAQAMRARESGASVPSWLPCGEPEAPAARAPPQR